MGNTELMSTAEVAKAANKSVATVTRWAIDGKLPTAYKAGGLRGFYMFRTEDVEAFLERTDTTTITPS